eukprot:SAG31_NODE_758_length_12292_cov_14.175511_10_plen_75_part_00
MDGAHHDEEWYRYPLKKLAISLLTRVFVYRPTQTIGLAMQDIHMVTSTRRGVAMQSELIEMSSKTKLNSRDTFL